MDRYLAAILFGSLCDRPIVALVGITATVSVHPPVLPGIAQGVRELGESALRDINVVGNPGDPLFSFHALVSGPDNPLDVFPGLSPDLATVDLFESGSHLHERTRIEVLVPAAIGGVMIDRTAQGDGFIVLADVEGSAPEEARRRQFLAGGDSCSEVVRTEGDVLHRLERHSLGVTGYDRPVRVDEVLGLFDRHGTAEDFGDIR